MSKQQHSLIDFDQDKQEVSNFKKQNKVETIRKYFYDLREKWNDKCYEQDCIYGNNHQDIKALSVKLSNFNIREGVTNLSIYSAKEVILDRNIKFNGGNFTVVAPIIKISSKINIDLSGENGSSYTGKAANSQWESNCIDMSLFGFIYTNTSGGCAISCNYNTNHKGGTNGINGLSGTSGKDSGNLIMIAQKYEGIDNLSINVSGGDGGRGQDGGDGASCNTCYITAPTKRAGGNGGNGGNAGLGGKKGNINICRQKNDILKSLSENNIEDQDGMDGTPGRGGEGGLGWKGCLYKSGRDGSKGRDGVHVVKENVQSKIPLLFEIKQDYAQFMKDYAVEAFENPKEYTEIIGQDTDFNSFL